MFTLKHANHISEEWKPPAFVQFFVPNHFSTSGLDFEFSWPNCRAAASGRSL